MNITTVQYMAAAADGEAYIEVADMIGQVVYRGNAIIRKSVIDEQIRLSSTLANGMYMLKLRSGSEHKVFHFVVEQYNL